MSKSSHTASSVKKIPNEPITEPVTKPIPEATPTTKEQGIKEAVPEGTTKTGRAEPEGRRVFALSAVEGEAGLVFQSAVCSKDS